MDILTRDPAEPAAVEELVEDMVVEVTSEESKLPKKKLRASDAHAEDDLGMNMESTDFLSSENKENIMQTIKHMGRKELEDLVLAKVVEAIARHNEVGKFRSKVQELQIQKDKMLQRVSQLQKQFVELAKGLKLLADNQHRDPNNLNQNKRRPPPIKFFRSVGLQVSIEPAVKISPTKVVHINNVINGLALNGMKPLNSTTHNIPNNIPKRPGPKSMTDPNAIKSTTNNSFPIPVSKANAQIPSPTKIATLPVGKQQQISGPTVVDLTEETGVADSSGNVYRLVNTAVPGSYQIVSTANGQGRPILLTTTATATSVGAPMQTLVVRNIAPKTVNATQLRPVAVIPNRGPPGGATVVRSPQPTKKLQLPPLPSPCAVSIQRAPGPGRSLKELPPKPTLTLSEQADGIVLSWMINDLNTTTHADISSYQIFACQESLAVSPGKTSNWKKVGDVRALPLPMACTLSQFTPGNRYFFIVRGIDCHGRSGHFCDPTPISLQKK